MSLLSIGRNAAIAEQLREVHGDVSTVASQETKDKLEDARKKLLDSLTPWIPGDFVVTYGLLLTAWKGIRGSFGWLLVVAGVGAVTYIVLGAFAVSGFTGLSNPKKFGRLLAVRTLVGFGVSIYAAVAIPASGWYAFKWFSDNELASVVTAGLAVAIPISLLKGFQKRYGVSLGS